MVDHYILLTKPTCGWCDKAKNLITAKGASYVEFNILEYSHLRDFLIANGVSSVPQVFQDGVWIGGFDDLNAWMDDDHTGN
jgi:glutaredoxin 3